MEDNRKYSTGNYICLSRWKSSSPLALDGERFQINDKPTFDDYNVAEYKLIHKKHKYILDAYLLDNEVEIIKCFTSGESTGDTAVKVKNFIDTYDEFATYNCLSLLDQPVLQTIKAPNSDVEFLKPEFECEILHRIERQGLSYNIGYFISKYNNLVFSCSWNDLGECESISVKSNEYNLVPYKKPIEWYEIESNFPCIVIDKMDNTPEMVCSKEDFYRFNFINDRYRLATNEEIDSLKIKEK